VLKVSPLDDLLNHAKFMTQRELRVFIAMLKISRDKKVYSLQSLSDESLLKIADVKVALDALYQRGLIVMNERVLS
jgi:DNA-binding MarR family transcriptional regulator